MDGPAEIDHPYALAERIGPLVRRVLARNPSPFTKTGTQTYIVGEAGEVTAIVPGPDEAEHTAGPAEWIGTAAAAPMA